MTPEFAANKAAAVLDEADKSAHDPEYAASLVQVADGWTRLHTALAHAPKEIEPAPVTVNIDNAMIKDDADVQTIKDEVAKAFFASWPRIDRTPDALLTVYVSIGNSDDKLTQTQWSEYVSEVAHLVNQNAMRVHGAWFSDTTAPWQNACWCFEVATEIAADVRGALIRVRRSYRQDSIAWAEVPITDFI